MYDEKSMPPAVQPPTFTSAQPVIDRPFEAAAWDDALGYPFRHWLRSRFSDGSFGLWYGADTIETSVQESVHHWRAGLLGDAGFTQPGIEIERGLYRVRLDAALSHLDEVEGAVRGLYTRVAVTLSLIHI